MNISVSWWTRCRVDAGEPLDEVAGHVVGVLGVVEVAPDERADGVERGERAAVGVEDDGALVRQLPGQVEATVVTHIARRGCHRA